MTRLIAKIMFSVLTAMILLPVLLAAQTSPEAFLGFKIGADRKLADYTQVQAYFQKLVQESPKINIQTIGTTTQKRPMIMAVITAEENMPRLDEYRAMARKLTDPRTLSETEARALAKEEKAIEGAQDHPPLRSVTSASRKMGPNN